MYYGTFICCSFVVCCLPLFDICFCLLFYPRSSLNATRDRWATPLYSSKSAVSSDFRHKNVATTALTSAWCPNLSFEFLMNPQSFIMRKVAEYRAPRGRATFALLKLGRENFTRLTGGLVDRQGDVKHRTVFEIR
jgi:hypothetical protein